MSDHYYLQRRAADTNDLRLVRADHRTADQLLRQRSKYYERLAREATDVRECERFADQAVTLLEVAVALKEERVSK